MSSKGIAVAKGVVPSVAISVSVASVLDVGLDENRPTSGSMGVIIESALPEQYQSR